MSCGVGCRRSSDLALLWRRLAGAAPIGLLAWEPPCAEGVALKRQRKTNCILVPKLFSSFINLFLNVNAINSPVHRYLGSKYFMCVVTWGASGFEKENLL